MEALLLAGGKAERLGDAAQGLPKPLVAGRRATRSPSTRWRASSAAGVTRVIVACRAGQEDVFVNALAGLGAEIDPVGRARSRSAAAAGCASPPRARRERGTVLALNGDELLDVDFAALHAEHERSGAAATIVVVAGALAVRRRRRSRRTARITGFREAPAARHWVNSGVYALGDEALARLPEQGDHEQTTFPELAAEGKLRGYRHGGVWLTVNTPKDLRRAEEFMAEHPEWRPQRIVG